MSLFIFSNSVDAQNQPKRIIVDDFERPGKQNSLGGDFGAFSDQEAHGSCYLFFFENKENNVYNGGKYALHIDWDTSKKGAFAGYWTDLRHLNLQGFNSLCFSVKGLKGGEIFKIGLRGLLNSEYETKIEINRVLEKGVPSEWQRVKIPLKWFMAVDNWDDVNILSINFENAFGSNKGAILIDDIAFE